MGGRLLYDRRRLTVDCTARNTSAVGAMLRVPAETALPEILEFELAGKEGPQLARLRWRRGDLIGIEFVGTPEANDALVRAQLEEQIAILRKENARLRAIVAGLPDGSY